MNNLLTYLLLLYSLSFNPQSQEKKTPYVINIATGAFVPTEMSPNQISSAIPIDVFEGKYFRLVQFYELPTDEERNDMADLGMTLVDYLPHYTYFAVIEEDFDWNSINLSNVRAVFASDMRFKKEAEIYFGRVPEHALIDGQHHFVVSYYKTLDINAIRPHLASIGRIIEEHPQVYQLRLAVTPGQLDSVASLPFVQFIGAIEPKPEKESYRWLSSSRTGYITTGLNGLNYSGAGVKVCVGESGALSSIAADFKGRLTEYNSGYDDHKNSVARRLAGAGNLDPRERGIAYGADCISSSGGVDISNFYDTQDLRFTNFSLGFGVGGGYNSGARNLDIFVNTRPLGMIAYSAGNKGTEAGYSPYNGFSNWGNISGAKKQNKNNFVTGSTYPDDEVIDFSSRGPSYDGRIFPQLVVKGVGGTSYASPKAIGVLAVLSEVYADKNAGLEPPSSLLKAVMLNTADDVMNEGPDFKTGYGRINARRAYNVIDAGQIIMDQVSTGETDVHSIVVPANTTKVNILICWADMEASVNASKALVNDLKLEVTDPNMVTYNPWVLDHTPNASTLNDPATRQIDTLNNVEQVTIDNPIAGTYTIEVTGDLVPFGPEEYYLVYEFLGTELTLVGPSGDFKLRNDDNLALYWDTYGSTDDVELEYQVDGGTWTSIASEPYSSVVYDWFPLPQLIGIHEFKVRAKQGALISESSVGTIGAVPSNLRVDWACGDVVQLSWNPIAGADSYQVYTIGTKYMEPVTSNITYNGNSAILTGLSTTESLYFAVAAKTGVLEGPRTNAVEKLMGDIDCNNFFTISPKTVSKTEVSFAGIVNAHTKVLTEVKFEYGSTTAYGSETASIPITSLSHEDTLVTFTETIDIGQGDTIHYRLKGLVDGVLAYGEDRVARLAPNNAALGTGLNNGGIQVSTREELQFNALQDFSVALWVKTTSGGTAVIIGEKNFFNLDNPGWAIYSLFGEWHINASNGTGTRVDLGNNGVLNDGKWHHLAVTFDRDGLVSSYLDGEFKQSTSFASLNNSDLVAGLPLGIMSDSNLEWELDGSVDEISIFRKVLSLQEVRLMMHQPLSGDESDLAAYWTFDQDFANAEDITQGLSTPFYNDATKTTSTVPFGVGTTTVAAEAVGIVSFPNEALEIDFSQAGTGDLLASKIALFPNDSVGIENQIILADEYWVVHRYSSASMSATLTFTSSADITTEDQTDPASLSLYQRDLGSDGEWTFVGTPASADAANDKVTFTGFTDFNKQYILARASGVSLFVSTNLLEFENQNLNCYLSYTVDGIRLLDDLIITAPAEFEVSETSGSGFAQSLTLSPVNGNISTTIYVRPATTGTLSGVITNATPGVNDEIITINPFAVVAITGQAGKAKSFDGDGDYLRIEDLNWSNPSNFTIEWWLYPANNASFTQHIGNGWNNGGFFFHTNFGDAAVLAGTEFGPTHIQTATPVMTTNEWQHFAFTYDNGDVILYRNGIEVGSNSGQPAATWNYFDIGTVATNTINGKLDEFRMWETTRTATEIRENMHLTLAGDEPGLRVYLQFHTTSGNVVDLSPNCYKVGVYGNTSNTDSDLAVASGVSVSKNVTSTGLVSFDDGGTDTDLDIDFPTISPNGQLVVSKLEGEGPHGTVASTNDSLPHYWIIRNYGSTNSGLGADMIFSAPSDWVTIDYPDLYEMYKRGSVSTGAWDAALPSSSVNLATNEMTFSGINDFSQFFIAKSDIPTTLTLQIRVLLEGPYNMADGLMGDVLRQNSYLPEEEPFTALGYNFVGATSGDMIDNPVVVLGRTGNDAIVDWIFVELRDKAAPTLVVATRSALLQRDGDVVDMDGLSPLLFSEILEGDYYIAIKHRNHLSVMTQSFISLTSTGNTIDFSDPALSMYGTDARKTVGSIMALWSGDATNDDAINAADRAEAWNDRNLTGNLLSDLDLSGSCNAADRVITWNNRNRSGQLP